MDHPISNYGELTSSLFSAFCIEIYEKEINLYHIQNNSILRVTSRCIKLYLQQSSRQGVEAGSDINLRADKKQMWPKLGLSNTPSTAWCGPVECWQPETFPSS